MTERTLKAQDGPLHMEAVDRGDDLTVHLRFKTATGRRRPAGTLDREAAEAAFAFLSKVLGK